MLCGAGKYKTISMVIFPGKPLYINQINALFYSSQIYQTNAVNFQETSKFHLK